MSDITKIRFSTMVSTELNQIDDMIRKEKTYARDAASEPTAQMHLSNIVDLEEYKELLLKLRECSATIVEQILNSEAPNEVNNIKDSSSLYKELDRKRARCTYGFWRNRGVEFYCRKKKIFVTASDCCSCYLVDEEGINV